VPDRGHSAKEGFNPAGPVGPHTPHTRTHACRQLTAPSEEEEKERRGGEEEGGREGGGAPAVVATSPALLSGRLVHRSI